MGDDGCWCVVDDEAAGERMIIYRVESAEEGYDRDFPNI